MGYKLEIDSKNQLIKIVATCELNQKIRKMILGDIAVNLKNYNYSRAMIDLTETEFDYHVPTTGASDLIAYMKIIRIPPQAKLAFIYSEAEPHRKHYEQVCQKEGYNVRYFRKLNDALEWLK